MPKCENCYHYDICKFNLEHQGIDLTSIVIASKDESSADGCPYFKDKSFIMEMPCRVGDTVYLLLETLNGEKEIIESECLKIYFVASKIKSKNELQLVFSMRFPCKEIGNTLEFGLCDFGKKIFLAREEAEKALGGKK